MSILALVRNFTCLLVCLPACATTYYVANAGNDSNPGTSSVSPWQTMARVNAGVFSPGDSILLKRGDTWHEELIPPSSGISGNQITISAYGTGANPVVTGGNLITQWQGGGPSGGGPTCTGSCLFLSGMETANFADWSSVYAPTIDGTKVSQTTTVVHSGSSALQLLGGGADNRGGLSESFRAIGAEGTLYFRFYMYVPVGALRPNDGFILFQVPQGSSNVTLYTDGSGNISSLQFYANGGTIVPYSPISFTMGAWNYFDIAFKAGTYDGGGQVWLNGASLGSTYNLNTSSSAGVTSILLGNDSFGHGQVAGGSIYLDDFEIATSGPIGALSTGSTPSVSPTGVYSAALANQPRVVFIAGNLGVQESSQSALTANGQWAWSQGTLYVYSSLGTPANVEVAQRDYALLLGQTGKGSYVTVSGVDFRIANLDVVHIVNTSGDVVSGGLMTGGYQFGIFAIGTSGATVSGLQVSNNTVSMNGSSGIEISTGHSNALVQGNTTFGNAFNASSVDPFIEMGGIKLVGTPGVPTYDLVQYNVSNNNGVYGGNESQGNGIWFDSIGNSTMQNNVSFANSSHGLYLEKTTGCSMLNNVSYFNGYNANTANIATYTSQGFQLSYNTVSSNVAFYSQNWGMKLGAYQGVGQSGVYSNTYSNNVVVGSQSIDLYADTGADNDGVNGYGNVYSGNAFGLPTSNWLYWVTYGFISNYAQFDAAYGSATNSIQSAWTQTIGGQERCTGSCIFSSGMETYNFSDWSAVYKPASDSTSVSQSGSLLNTGLHGLQITGSGADNRGGLIESFPALGSEGLRYFRFYMYIPAGALKANDKFTIFEAPAYGSNLSLSTDANGNVVNLEYDAAGGGAIVPATAVSFTMGAWNYFDIAFRAGSSDGGGEVWLNGSAVGGNFSLNTSSSAGLSNVLVGNDSYGHGQVAGGSIYIDDFRIATSGPIGEAPVTLPVAVP